MTTEKEKMLRGEMYNALDPQLCEERARARKLCKIFNDSNEDEGSLRKSILQDLFVSDTAPWIEPPFYCDYGSNIKLLGGAYFNFNCVVLDVAPVTIGDGVMCGPAVQIYTATHPLNAEERCGGKEFGKPVTIGEKVWIGGGAIICPGVTIGDRAVIGAGSVVTKDIPDDVFAAGNPCRVIREIT